MIPQGTLLAGPGLEVELISPGTFVYTWETSPVSKPVTVTPVSVTSELVEVETWFSGCRGCNHKNPERAKTGMIVQVSAGSEFLLKNGGFVAVEDLSPGQRLLAIGCKCGYEEVREVRTVVPPNSVMLYEISGVENYGITDGKHILVVRSQ